MRDSVLFTLIMASVISSSVCAETAEPRDAGVKFVNATTVRWRVGVEIDVQSGMATGVTCYAPIPDDWPEQQVKLVDQQLSPNVRRVGYRSLDDGAKQMAVYIPTLGAGDKASAILTFEVTKSRIETPDEPSQLEIPRRLPRSMRAYLEPSPLIESEHATIRSLAAEIVQDTETAWDQVEAVYDWVRENVQYKEGDMKGALAALRDRDGDCEELTSLFIALCRANDIPARTVWVPGHCYPEFYLEDKQGKGHWFPCQAAGDRAFGSMPDARIILQKGDNFKVPELSDRVRYAQTTLKAANQRGVFQPAIKYISEPVDATD